MKKTTTLLEFKLNETQLSAFDPNKIKAWAEALTSGQYEQVTGGMCDPNKPNSACCLHVAAMAVDDLPWEDALKKNKGHTQTVGMPQSLYSVDNSAIIFDGRGNTQWFSVDASDMSFTVRLAESGDIVESEAKPAILNDTYMLTFEQIAELITEKQLTCDCVGHYTMEGQPVSDKTIATED